MSVSEIPCGLVNVSAVLIWSVRTSKGSVAVASSRLFADAQKFFEICHFHIVRESDGFSFCQKR